MNKFCIILLWAFSLHVIPIELYGQTRIVQGKILKIEKNKKKPFNSIPVTLYNPNNGSRSVRSITDINGKYYFYNIPEGTYKLEIWIYGTVAIKDRESFAKVYEIRIDYDKAISKNDYKLLRLDPIRISL